MRAEGKTFAAISLHFKVPEPTVRKGIKAMLDLAAKKAESTEAAKKIDAEIDALHPAKQKAVLTMADHFVVISEQLAGAARFGAMTAHRLNGIAHSQVMYVDDGDPFSADSMRALSGVALLTKLANSSAEIGIGLIRANKDAIDDLNKAGQQPPEPKQIVFTVVDASADT